MRKDLQNKLFQDFPLLYRDKNESVYKSSMGWGICTGDGWHDLIRDLSSNLETMLKKLYDEHPNPVCLNCICEKQAHVGSKTLRPGKCLNIKKRPRKRIYNDKSTWFKKLVYPFYRAYNWFHRAFNYELRACWCEQYNPALPRAVQVKEKYGSLRFYMNSSTQEMDKIIDEAESKSHYICPDCGNSKDSTQLLCDSCNSKDYK